MRAAGISLSEDVDVTYSFIFTEYYQLGTLLNSTRDEKAEKTRIAQVLVSNSSQSRVCPRLLELPVKSLDFKMDLKWTPNGPNKSEISLV